MANEIRHSSASKPRIYPWNEDALAQDIDRVQNISGGVSQPSEDVYEVGRQDKVCTDLKILEGKVTLTQLEYGEIDFYLALANKSTTPVGGLTLSDFDSSLFDIIIVNKDKFNGTMEQTVWIPKLSVNSISLDIANAEARVERSFDFGGDFFRILKNLNKVFVEAIDTVPTGYSDDPFVMTLADPIPAVDVNVAGKYIQRVLRTRGADTTELTLTTDYTFSAPSTLTILSATSGDIYKVAFEAASFGTGGDYTSLNDVDLCYITADSVRVTLESASDGVEVELDRLTSLNVAATLNRISEGVIGLEEKLLKQIESYAVTVALNGRVKDAAIEDVLMGHAGENWSVIDPKYFKTDLILRVYFYEDSSKATFKIGYKSTGLSFADNNQDTAANSFWTGAINLKSDNMLISNVEADIDA